MPRLLGFVTKCTNVGERLARVSLVRQMAIRFEPRLQGLLQNILDVERFDSPKLSLQGCPLERRGDFRPRTSRDRNATAELGQNVVTRWRWLSFLATLLRCTAVYKILLRIAWGRTNTVYERSTFHHQRTPSILLRLGWATADGNISANSRRTSSAAGFARAPIFQTTPPCPGASA